MPQPLYARGTHSIRMGRTPNWSVCLGEQDESFSLAGIKPHSLSIQARNLVTMPTTLFRFEANSERDFRGISCPKEVSPTYSRNAQGHVALFRYCFITQLIAFSKPYIIDCWNNNNVKERLIFYCPFGSIVSPRISQSGHPLGVQDRCSVRALTFHTQHPACWILQAPPCLTLTL
jgi:hypothetical protein